MTDNLQTMDRGYSGQKKQPTQPANTISAHAKGKRVRVLWSSM